MPPPQLPTPPRHTVGRSQTCSSGYPIPYSSDAPLTRHLGVHLGPAPIADRVVKVAGELHEQLGGQARLWLSVFDVKQQLATRAAAGYFFAQVDPRDALSVSAQRTRCVKCVGEKGDTAVAKGSGVGGEREP